MQEEDASNWENRGHQGSVGLRERKQNRKFVKEKHMADITPDLVSDWVITRCCCMPVDQQR